MKRKNFVPFRRSRIQSLKYSILITVTAQIIILASVSAYSASLTLAWDANQEPDVAGYKVYYGMESREYIYAVDIGNQTSCTISGLIPHEGYYFSVTAYDIESNESSFSEEIFYQVPLSTNRKSMPWIPLLLLDD